MNSFDDPIVITQTFEAPITNVWNALTVHSEMVQWYFSNIPSFDPTEGFETAFTVQTEERVFPHTWKITEVIPMKKIAYEWKFEGYIGSGISIFELSSNENQTILDFTFITTKKFPDNIPEFKRESGVQGWNYFIKERLVNYLS